MASRKKGRPALQGTPVGLKPYLSQKAVDFLNQQKSKSAFVARLIEEAAANPPECLEADGPATAADTTE